MKNVIEPPVRFVIENQSILRKVFNDSGNDPYSEASIESANEILSLLSEKNIITKFIIGSDSKSHADANESQDMSPFFL